MSTHEHNEDRTEQVVSTLLSRAGEAPVPPDEAFLDRLSGETVSVFIAASAQRPKRFRGYRIMQTRTLKWLIPAAAAAAIILGVSLWSGKGGGHRGNGVAWADVVRSFQQARTVQFTYLHLDPEGRIVNTSKIFVKEPGFSREERADGKIYIGNLRAGGEVLVLVLDTKQAVFESIAGKVRDENLYEKILRFMSAGAEPMGVEMLGGKQAMVFWNQSQKTKVWADPQTCLPIRIELWSGPVRTTYAEAESLDRQLGMGVNTDFVFNVPLDDSLFSLTPPEGYQMVPISATPSPASTTTKHAMKKFGPALFAYAAEHNEQFPRDLSELAPFGITAQDLVNPARPEKSPGYIYIRPTSTNNPQLIVMYEAYDQWDRGVNVLYLDGHTASVNDESRFLKQLEFTKKQNANNSAK